MTRIKDTYDNPQMYITENGWSDNGEIPLEDPSRSSYYIDYINQVLKAVKVDGVNIKGYTAWSLVIDNYLSH